MDSPCFIDLNSMVLALRHRIITILSAGGGGGSAHAQNTSWKVVPFGEISVYRSDPRHVAKLMSRSDGLDAVSTARARRGGEV